MKFINALFLLAGLPCTTVALRGAMQNKHHRSLINGPDGDEYKYETLNGACRLNTDGSGEGDEGEDFQRFEYADYADEMDRNWCESLCDEEGRDCTGYEYFDSGDESYCSVWLSDIRGFNSDVDDSKLCFVRVYPVDDGDDDDDEEEQQHYEHLEGACRKDPAGTNPGREGKDFVRIAGKDETWCRDSCDHPTCFGYETYEKYPGTPICELHYTAIWGFEALEGFDCYVKPISP